ncbi:MAG: hypothetical protein MI924_17775 [Chloroflexales bacterium]|nr:hypothetical protein [Chloroflexales bacterium]
MGSIAPSGGTPITLSESHSRYAISPDSKWVVFSDNNGLYRVPLNGGTVTQLATYRQDNVWDIFTISSNSRYVVYIASASNKLYSVPIDGGPSVQLGAQIAERYVSNQYRISPDNRRVIYITNSDSQPEIYSISIQGGTATMIDTALPECQSAFCFTISSDSKHIVYLTNPDPANTKKVVLASAPIAGGAPTTLVGPLPIRRVGEWRTETATISSVQISADSRWVVYRANLDTEDNEELYSVPLAGGSVVKLNKQLPPDEDVKQFYILADNTVLYHTLQDTPGSAELFTTPITGGALTKRNDPLTLGGAVRSPVRLTPDGKSVVYVASQDIRNVDLYIANVAPLRPGFAAPGATVADTAGSYPISVRLDQPPEQAVTVTYTTGGSAVEGVDYSIGAGIGTAATGTLTFAPGEISKTILVQLKPNPAALGPRTLVVNLSSNDVDLSGAETFTLTITNSNKGVFLPQVIR